MQTILIHVAILSLMVFVCGVVSRTRKDDRLTCWRAAWILVLAHYLCEIAHPATAFGLHLRSLAVTGALGFAGIFFIVSTMVRTEGRQAGLRLGLTVSLITLPVFGLVIFSPHWTWLLGLAVLVRQAVAVAVSFRIRPNRPLVASVLTAVIAISGVSCGYAIFRAQPFFVILVLLGELFMVAAIDFWCNGWAHTVGLHTMAISMTAWSLLFPLWDYFQSLFPKVTFNGELWNLPTFGVASGMILLVLEEDARAAHRLSDEYQRVFQGNPHPLWIFAADTLRFVAANDAALRLHGYTREEFLGLRLSDVLDAASGLEAECLTESKLPTHPQILRHLRKDGTPVVLEVEAHEILFDGRKCRFVLGLDVSERDALEKQLIHQSRHDPLTGLANRMLFEEQMIEAAARTAETDEKLAILCIDICRFKHVNDVHGPRVGDECIKAVGELLVSAVTATDFAARTGGDEFALGLTLRNAAAAEQFAADLREQLERPMLILGCTVQFTACIGLAIFPDDGTDVMALWRGAEDMLRRAQAAGGGQTLWLSPELRAEAEEQIEIESSMRMKLEDAGFHLVYQPVYGLDGGVHSLEALIRLDHATYGPVSPAKVIPIAEETGLIFPLGLWVVEQVCGQQRRWMDDGVRTVPVAINVSALQLMHGGFAERVFEALQRYDLDPQWIHLEVTETAAMRNLKEVSGQMDALSSAGISFSIDDFGTGHSSLGRLNQLPISVLKIDRSFIDQLCGPSESYTTLTIVQAILSMAHALGQQVVAEGVETAAQLACLRSLNCDLLQGFLLSMPVAPEDVPPLMTGIHAAFQEAPETGCYSTPAEPDERALSED